MQIDWTLTESDELKDIADAMADAADLNLGLPFALVMTAVERGEARVKATGSDEGLTRHAFIAELRDLITRFRTEGVENC